MSLTLFGDIILYSFRCRRTRRILNEIPTRSDLYSCHYIMGYIFQNRERRRRGEIRVSIFRIAIVSEEFYWKF